MLADDRSELDAIQDLDSATNDRLRAQRGLLPGLSVSELVTNVPNAEIINAAFAHAHPLGSRFGGPDRGAWYAGFEFGTARAEVIFHKAVQLSEINYFTDSITYDDYLADLSGGFHDLRTKITSFAKYLDPNSYIESQKLGAELLRNGSLGIVYPSVRNRPSGTCVVCFRPAAVSNVRRSNTYRFVWNGTPKPSVSLESEK